MSAVRRFLHALSDTFGVIACVALVLMMIHVSVDVFAKYVLNYPIAGTLEVVSAYYMVAVVFLPLAYVERNDGHISIEIFAEHLPSRIREFLIAGTSILAAIYFALLTYQTGGDAIEKYEIGEYVMGTTAVTTWPSRFLLPLGCGLITILLLYKAYRLIRGDRSVLKPDKKLTRGE